MSDHERFMDWSADTLVFLPPLAEETEDQALKRRVQKALREKAARAQPKPPAGGEA